MLTAALSRRVLTRGSGDRRESRDVEDLAATIWVRTDTEKIEGLGLLGWRHRRMYDGKATMITLAIDDGASRDIIKNRVTHARPVEDAFDHYYRGTQWLETCAELSKLKISRQPARGKLVAL